MVLKQHGASTAESPDLYPPSWEGFVVDIKLSFAAVVQRVPQFYSKHMWPCHLLYILPGKLAKACCSWLTNCPYANDPDLWCTWH